MGDDGADWWLSIVGTLPDYYITQQEAEKLGYRSKDRILFSNDGLIFVTYDHYLTFQEVI